MPTEAPAAHSVPAPADVRAALVRVQQSDAFARSPQLQRLLAYLVDETLAGRDERLKEYVIGLEVFARPDSYDPRTDSLVRVEARRLRVALAQYYAVEGRHDPVVIDLRKGAYVPSFRESPGPRPDGATPVPVAPTDGTAARGQDAATAPHPASWWPPRGRMRPASLLLAGAMVVIVLMGIIRAWRSKPVEALTDRDSVLLAGFVNATGDPVFDETLKQGLATELEQSPFLNLVSERRVAEVLRLAGRGATDRLEHEVARDACLRAGGKAVIAGSINRLGTQFVIGLTATDCASGDDFVHVQQTAARKEAVLSALSVAAGGLRRRLGESLASTQRFGLPIEEATTSSLEALQAFSLGRKTAREKGSPADIPFYERALELDPSFAAAHAALGVSLINQGQPTAGADHLEKAYSQRGRVSEREKYRISAYYLQAVTGDLEKAAEVYEVWQQNYPREYAPRVNLGLSHLWLGGYDKALVETREALRLEPGNVLPYTNLAALLIKVERRDEASAVLQQAAARRLTSTFLRLNLCYLAFLAGDSSVAARQLAEVRDKPAEEGPLLALDADTAAYSGRAQAARRSSRQAVECGRRAGSVESAATWLLVAAMREAEYGYVSAAREAIREALDLAQGRDVLTLAALAAARAGDTTRAAGLLRHLRDAHPRSTVIASYWGPTIEAAIELRLGNPRRALELLEPVAPVELGSPPPIGLATLYPVYLRGEAYLRAGQGDAAAREFQKILDRPGLVLNFPLGPLSRLGLARARRLSGDPAGAAQAYDGFLHAWAGADADLPVLQRARAERRSLR